MTARVIHQDFPHELCRHGEKMGSILPLRQTLFRQAYIRLVNQCRALQSMAGTFAVKVVIGDLAQFAIHERHQRIQRCLIAAPPANQEFRYFIGRPTLQVSAPQVTLGMREA
jgi:hypothetical protein